MEAIAGGISITFPFHLYEVQFDHILDQASVGALHVAITYRICY
jgi:hypothetical protein